MRVLRELLGDALKLVVPCIALGLIAAVFWVRIADPSWYPLGGVEPIVYTLAATAAFLVAVIARHPSAAAPQPRNRSSRRAPNSFAPAVT